MRLAPTERQRALRAELRAYFRAVMPPGARTPGALAPDEQRRLLRRIGTDGWLGLGWPVEYGGQGRGPDEQFVFFDEAYRAGAPVSMVTLNTVGPTLMRYGTAEQKERFLPGILSGETVFAIGYTEPEAGTDLASLRTRAVREPLDGEGAVMPSGTPSRTAPGGGAGTGGGVGWRWRIDGAKSFTSNAQHADWIWLACRTAPEAPKHRGISILLVPTDAPGFSWTPIETVGGLTTTATYYDGVRVPAAHLVGEENAGWDLITNQLNHERVALAALGMQAGDHFTEVLDAVRASGALEQPWARGRLAEAYARLAATRLLNWRLVGDVGAGSLAPGDASGVKFAGTESTVAVYALCQEVLGEQGLLRAGAPGAFGDGELERMNRAAQINTFGGGVSEVQREIVATTRLGMRRTKR
ncbi:acyl-CoA dehydrogenase family protein [Streptomyces albiaxialis]|uniref:Acyl-CoA dehydrogenase family protein n=1 Tax=Streptomyces albiaxialis TaxID=329523 RepID=A0ABP5H4L6_9ACTN